MAKEHKITCKTFLAEISDYIDGALADEMRVSIEAHLARCPDCWVVFDETKRTVQIFRSLKCQPLPKDVHQRLLSALEKRWQK